MRRGGGWWARVESNHRPLACEANALPLSHAPDRIFSLTRPSRTGQPDRARFFWELGSWELGSDAYGASRIPDPESGIPKLRSVQAIAEVTEPGNDELVCAQFLVDDARVDVHGEMT